MTSRYAIMISDLNPIQRDIYEAVKAVARDGKPCPSNLALSMLVDRSLETTARYLSGLQDVGLIAIENPRPRCRIVTVHEIGKSTAAPPPKKMSISTAKYHTPEKASQRLQASLDKDRLAEARRVTRDPCFACGVPADRHDQGGCKRWRPRG